MHNLEAGRLRFNPLRTRSARDDNELGLRKKYVDRFEGATQGWRLMFKRDERAEQGMVRLVTDCTTGPGNFPYLSLSLSFSGECLAFLPFVWELEKFRCQALRRTN